MWFAASFCETCCWLEVVICGNVTVSPLVFLCTLRGSYWVSDPFVAVIPGFAGQSAVCSGIGGWWQCVEGSSLSRTARAKLFCPLDCWSTGSICCICQAPWTPPTPPHPTTVFTRDRGLAFSHGLRFGKCMDFQPRYLIAGADGLANCVMSLPADGEVKQCLGAAWQGSCPPYPVRLLISLRLCQLSVHMGDLLPYGVLLPCDQLNTSQQWAF